MKPPLMPTPLMPFPNSPPPLIAVGGDKDTRVLGFYSHLGGLIYWAWWDRLTDAEVGQLFGGN